LKTKLKSRKASTLIEDFLHEPYGVFSFGYSLFFHALVAAIVLFLFSANPLPKDHPISDYIMVMLSDPSETAKKPARSNLRSKSSKPVIRQKPKPAPKAVAAIPKKAEEISPVKAEVSHPMETKPSLPPPAVPESSPNPPPLSESPSPPVKAELPEPKPALPPQPTESPSLPTAVSPLPEEPKPVVETPPPAPEPPPVSAKSAEIEPAVSEPAPPLPASPPVINIPEPQPPPEPPAPVAKNEEVAPVVPPAPEPPPVETKTAEVEQKAPELKPPPPVPAESPLLETKTMEPETKPVPLLPTPPPVVKPPEPPPAPEPPAPIAKTEEARLSEPTKPLVQALVETPKEPAPIQPVSPEIVVTEPREGAVLNIAAGSSVLVRGAVNDPTIKTATVIINGGRIEVRIHEGRFETMVPNLTDENSLFVEATNAAGLTGQSPRVRFFTTRPQPIDIQVILELAASCGDIRLKALKGDHPQSRGYAPFKTPAEINASPVEYRNSSPYLAKALAIEKAESGVYTIQLGSLSAPSVTACDSHLVVILYGFDRSRIRTKVFQASTASPWITARFLMPQGLFWDDDDWTTGQIEDGRSVTKFNTDQGIIWKEKK
jgi:hypothetical protein